MDLELDDPVALLAAAAAEGPRELARLGLRAAGGPSEAARSRMVAAVEEGVDDLRPGARSPGRRFVVVAEVDADREKALREPPLSPVESDLLADPASRELAGPVALAAASTYRLASSGSCFALPLRREDAEGASCVPLAPPGGGQTTDVGGIGCDCCVPASCRKGVAFIGRGLAAVIWSVEVRMWQKPGWERPKLGSMMSR